MQWCPSTLQWSSRHEGTFPQRNRLISGSADAVVVVEAGASSGALLTASWALEQGRECFLVPGSIDAPASAGCNGFLREWPDPAHIVSGMPQLLDDLGLCGAAGLPAPHHGGEKAGVVIKSTVRPPSAAAVLQGRGDSERSVAEAIIHGAVSIDEVVAVTRLSSVRCSGRSPAWRRAGWSGPPWPLRARGTTCCRAGCGLTERAGPLRGSRRGPDCYGPAVIRAILHLLNDQPLVVELLAEPTPGDIALICTNIRMNDGKKPTFIDYTESTFVFPMAAVRFVEILTTDEAGQRLQPALSDEPAEAEDLEIDEDFLRRVRDA